MVALGQPERDHVVVVVGQLDREVGRPQDRPVQRGQVGHVPALEVDGLLDRLERWRLADRPVEDLGGPVDHDPDLPLRAGGGRERQRALVECVGDLPDPPGVESERLAAVDRLLDDLLELGGQHLRERRVGLLRAGHEELGCPLVAGPAQRRRGLPVGRGAGGLRAPDHGADQPRLGQLDCRPSIAASGTTRGPTDAGGDLGGSTFMYSRLTLISGSNISWTSTQSP